MACPQRCTGGHRPPHHQSQCRQSDTALGVLRNYCIAGAVGFIGHRVSANPGKLASHTHHTPQGWHARIAHRLELVSEEDEGHLCLLGNRQQVAPLRHQQRRRAQRGRRRRRRLLSAQQSHVQAAAAPISPALPHLKGLQEGGPLQPRGAAHATSVAKLGLQWETADSSTDIKASTETAMYQNRHLQHTPQQLLPPLPLLHAKQAADDYLPAHPRRPV